MLVANDPFSESPAHPIDNNSKPENEALGFLNSIENIIPGGSRLEEGSSSSPNGLPQ